MKHSYNMGHWPLIHRIERWWMGIILHFVINQFHEWTLPLCMFAFPSLQYTIKHNWFNLLIIYLVPHSLSLPHLVWWDLMRQIFELKNWIGLFGDYGVYDWIMRSISIIAFIIPLPSCPLLYWLKKLIILILLLWPTFLFSLQIVSLF